MYLVRPICFVCLFVCFYQGKRGMQISFVFLFACLFLENIFFFLKTKEHWMYIKFLVHMNITSPWCSTDPLIFIFKYYFKFDLTYLKSFLIIVRMMTKIMFLWIITLFCNNWFLVTQLVLAACVSVSKAFQLGHRQLWASLSNTVSQRALSCSKCRSYYFTIKKDVMWTQQHS